MVIPIKSAAIGIIFNQNNTRILLVKRKDIPIWVLPGGGIDLHESPEEAVVREIKEETGMDVCIERKSAEYYPQNQLGAYTNVFVCKITGGEQSLSEETTDIGFYPINHYPPLFFEIHAIWIEDALKHSDLIRAPLKGVSYTQLVKYFLKHPLYVLRYILIRLKKSVKE